MRADLAALGGLDHYAPGLRLGFTGDVAISSEEMAALVQDLTVSSLLVVVVVVIALIVFYRWRRSVAVLFLPLSIATVLAFALASLPPFNITELNSNTAFLGSIIIGNGINFGIVQLARYVEARRAGHAIEDSLAITLWGTRKGTLSAAVAAGAAYASLVAMQFRGFRQFGVIGGLGMLLCWGATFLLAPSLIAWLDHGKLRAEPNRAAAPADGGARAAGDRPPAHLRGRRRALLTVLAGLEIRHFGHDQLEYDFSRLRRRDTWIGGEGYWGAKMDSLLGRYLSPDGAADRQRGRGARHRRQAARGGEAPAARRDGGVDADHRRRAAAGSRREARRGRGDPPQDDAQAAREAQPGGHQAPRRSDRRRARSTPIRIEQIPDVLTTGLRERDGALGRAVLVYPNPTNALWRGKNISAFVERAARGRGGAGRDGRAPGARRGRAAADVGHHRVDAARRAAGVAGWRSRAWSRR